MGLATKWRMWKEYKARNPKVRTVAWTVEVVVTGAGVTVLTGV
jgi:hypothetical protein